MRLVIFFCCLVLTSVIGLGAQKLSVSNVFSDHMVLQRDHSITIWGKAIPGSAVALKFKNEPFSTVADMEGNWAMMISKQPAGGPYQFTIQSGTDSVLLNDVYFGDVWLCSGQSNMEWIVSSSDGYETTKANADDEMIRHFKVNHSTSINPADEIDGGPWVVNSSEAVGNFTAVGYYFAEVLRKEIDVPIGLLNSSWGGSRIEPWMNAKSLKMDDPVQYLENIEANKRKEFEARMIEIKKRFPGIEVASESTQDEGDLVKDFLTVDEEWNPIEVPGLWESQGYADIDGIAWYRKKFMISPEESKEPAMVRLAKIDDTDKVWINGHFVGGLEQQYNTLREYSIGSDILRQGENTILVRVEDTGGGGGIHGDASNLSLTTSKQEISLAGEWHFRIQSFMPFTFTTSDNKTPMLLYNKMIHPILRFPIKGVIWYQGESNAGNLQDALAYEDLFQTMIKQWRSDWGIGDFPFLFVQLANFMAADDNPVESNWAVLRASQSAATRLENVGEAVIIDIGEADDIHPRNKKDVGHRLALDALKLAYGRELVSSGPLCLSHLVDRSKFILDFDQELVVKDKYGYINGFAIAGDDGQYVWAKALANGNQIEVWHPQIAEPTSLRYAWGNNPDDVNLYNADGLPARPFQIESK